MADDAESPPENDPADRPHGAKSAAAAGGTPDDDGDGAADRDGEKAPDQGPKLYQRPIFWIILVAVLIALAVGGTLYWLHARRFQSTDDAFIDTHIVRIAPETAGKLVRVLEADNRHVQAGQILVEIEPVAAQATVAQERAGIVQAQASYRQSLAQIAVQRATRAQAAADAVAPAAEAVRARADYARYLALRQKDAAAVAASQIDQARATALGASAQAAAARRAVDAADAQTRVAQRQAEASRAAIGAARARLSEADVTIGHLTIRAPVSGHLVNRQVNIGSYVAPGQAVMALVPDALWVTANFKETQLQRMRIGQHVDIKVDAFPDVKFEGHVDSIQRGAGQAFAILPPQNATGNYVKVVQRVPVRILFDRPDPRKYPLGPGMSVEPRVTVR